MNAIRQHLGADDITDDVVLPAPANRLIDDPMMGMALHRNGDANPVAAHCVLLLVQGTGETECESRDDSLSSTEQSFKVVSGNVRCLLSDTTTTIQLVAYCNGNAVSTYRLG